MQVAILAGGWGTRLGELTRNQPKSLVRVLGKPFLEYQLEFLKKGGIEDIVLCVGHLGEQIESYFGEGRKFGVKIKYSYEKKPLGTAGAIRNAEALLAEVFFTLYGDSYIFVDFGAMMSYFLSRSRLAMMSVYRNCDWHETSNTVVTGEQVKFYSKTEKRENMVCVEYGANIFRKEVLEMVPAGEAYGLEDFFPRLIEKGELLAFEVKERYYEIGSPQGLKEFAEYLRGTR